MNELWGLIEELIVKVPRDQAFDKRISVVRTATADFLMQSRANLTGVEVRILKLKKKIRFY